MKFIIRITIILLSYIALGCNGKSSSNEKVITISIPPLEALITNIVGSDYKINTILQSGSTPENYSPTPTQLINTEKSEFVFFVGTLAFEQEIAQKLENKGINIINTGKNASLIEGECNHNHTDATHLHNIDPHIWMSLIELEKIVDNIGSTICSANPDSLHYKANYEQLKDDIRAKHQQYKSQFESVKKVKFAIYHPALTYMARDYDLHQMSVEQEGKAPTPSTIAELSETVNNYDVELLLYQKEYPLEVVKPIADILNIKVLEINPLNSDILTEIDHITNILINPNYDTERVN